MKRPNDYEGIMGERYQEAMAVLCPNQDKASKVVLERLALLFSPNWPKTGLDLGCGGGEFLRSVIERKQSVGDSACVFGVDSSPLMIERARKNLAEYLNPQWNQIVQADLIKYLEAMNLIGMQVDFITENFVLHNLTKRQRAKVFPLVYGALQEDGLFIMQDKISVDNLGQHARDYAQQIVAIESFRKQGLKKLIEPWKSHYAVDDSPQRRMPQEQLISDLRDVGLRGVKVIYRDKMEAVVEARK